MLFAVQTPERQSVFLWPLASGADVPVVLSQRIVSDKRHQNPLNKVL